MPTPAGGPALPSSSGSGGREKSRAEKSTKGGDAAQTASAQGNNETGDKTTREQSQTGPSSKDVALETSDESGGGAESEDVALESGDESGGGAESEGEPSLDELLEVLEAENSGEKDTDLETAAGTAQGEQDILLEEAVGAMEADAALDAASAQGEGGDSAGGTGELDTVLEQAESGAGIEGELAELNQALDESLGQFDGEILSGRRSAQARGDEQGAGAGGTDINVAEDAETGDLEDAVGAGALPGDTSSGGGLSPGGAATAREGDYEHASAGNATVPPDIPDGSDDDVVARQIREAAMKEQDPELREKLWEEYRKYKASQ